MVRGVTRGWRIVLRVCDVDPSVRGRGVLEEVSVEASLLGSQGMGRVDLLPVLGLGCPLADQVGDAGGLALLGGELVDQDTAKEGGHGQDRSFL